MTESMEPLDTSPAETDERIRRAERIAAAMPRGGLFAEKAWRVSPEPFPLESTEIRALERLGPLLLRFQRACDLIYRRSRKGTLPAWIAGYLDRGKPGELLELGLASPVAEALPRVIRPDLILTDDGFTVTELDSVPGGIGLTAWLGRTYAGIVPEHRIVGGADGMLQGFHSVFGDGGADIAVSEESRDYRPEMAWLAEQLGPAWGVVEAERFTPGRRSVYRFFELFDLPNLPAAAEAARLAARGDLDITSPFKPWLEEKMWAALLSSPHLAPVWRRELRASNYDRLRRLFPESWVVDPAEVPPHAAIPGLGIPHFSELAGFTQSRRKLVLKLSGFHELAWGSRSVVVGHDVQQGEWAAAVERALASYDRAPYVLQRFHGGRIVTHPWFNPATAAIERMKGRVRLCPYYFVAAGSREIRLGGALATICPSDKKVLHGMSEAILVPCCAR